ncbi:eukaryotic translation initiation factor 4 gamma 1 [Halyomorpha halys]|uniref:eukaryotic translation initiation factor 4 gamma 1 n=1 Tax=Halyomorpha halys TaxID=286706 RepID=UPI0006D517F4|nr:eukaryotic translation initiation factor 4 gamma 1-like [Halyomorpha halys]
MGPAKKFYSLNPGESLEELRRQRGISLCELLDEIDKIENQTERSIPCKELAFENLSEDDKLAQELLKKLRGALNKLAPDNFYTQLMEMQCTLPVHNLHLMRMFVRQLIQKASKDTFYSLLYAYACKALSSIELIELPEDDDSIETFGALVLDECYKYFCYNRSSLNWFYTRDPNREELISLDRKEFMKRKTLVGLVRFIGGLFKADLLTVKETFEYIKKLENEVNEKSIEALCCLLSNYGKDLEAAALQTEFAGDWCATWERIAKLSKKESNLPLRQMFMLMDLLDLMNNGWVPNETFGLRSPMSHIEILMDYQEKEKDLPKKSKARMPKKKNKTAIVQPSESVNVSDSIIADDPIVVMTEQEIIRLLKSDGDVYNMISNWEIKNFEGRKTWFVYSLMRAILRVSIDGNTLNHSKFTEHIELLKKYMSSRQAEVACMYAVQYLVVVEMSNPKGLLDNITLVLYKTGAVTYIGLLDWRENWSKHPLLEVRGRAAAHIALASLFMKLFWESTRPNYKSIVKELNSFDLEHFVSSSKLPPEIAKRIKMEEERDKTALLKKQLSKTTE